MWEWNIVTRKRLSKIVLHSNMSKINCPDELWKFKPAWLSHAEQSFHSCLSAEHFAANRDAHRDSHISFVKAQYIYILNYIH